MRSPRQRRRSTLFCRAKIQTVNSNSRSEVIVYGVGVVDTLAKCVFYALTDRFSCAGRGLRTRAVGDFVIFAKGLRSGEDLEASNEQRTVLEYILVMQVPHARTSDLHYN